MHLNTALELASQHPHDFTIQYPPRREYFKDSFQGPPNLELAREQQELLLYIHVPFCAARCYYCNFAVDVRPHEHLHTRYVNGLIRQLEVLPELIGDVPIGGIDIGGGTPTLLKSRELRRLLAAIQPWRSRSTRLRPLSIETTPAIAAKHPERLEVLHRGSVQRVSMGLQSTDETFLRMVNRSSQLAAEVRAVQNLKAVGFDRLSVDLIFGLPGQTAEHWQRDLERVLVLEVDTITTYDCLYRGKGRALTRRQTHLPSPGLYGELYDQAYEFLTGHGFHAPYGSVNYSRRPDETGTSAYFEGRLLDGLPYLGLGNYASSLLDDQWFFAPHAVDTWLAKLDHGELFPVGDCYHLPLAERAAKYLLLGLSFGVVDARRFQRALGAPLEDVVGPALQLAETRGWLVRLGDQWRIPPGGFRHMPKLRAIFYTPEALNWLKAQERTSLKLVVD